MEAVTADVAGAGVGTGSKTIADLLPLAAEKYGHALAEARLGHDLVLGHGQHLDGTLLEPGERLLIHDGSLSADWVTGSCAESVPHRARDRHQCPIPSPPSTGITAPVM